MTIEYFIDVLLGGDVDPVMLREYAKGLQPAWPTLRLLAQTYTPNGVKTEREHFDVCLRAIRVSLPKGVPMSESKIECGWTKAFHPSGLQVTLPVSYTALTAEDYACMLTNVTNMLAGGWLVQPPGIEPGEEVDECSHVMICHQDKAGEIIPIVKLYANHEKVVHSILNVYLDNSGCIAAFEKATGLKLDKLPVFDGDRLARDGSAKAKKYIVAAARPFKVVMKKNPKFSAEERQAAVAAGKSYFVPKHIFVRWDGQPAVSQKPQPAEEAPARTQPQPGQPDAHLPAPAHDRKAPAIPTNGIELFQRLCAAEEKLRGEKKVRKNELINHVRQHLVKAGYPANYADVTGAAIPFATEVATAFIKAKSVAA